MRSRIILFLMILNVFVINTKTVLASHAAGLDITYECLNTNQYRVTLTFYRECGGVGAPNGNWIDPPNQTYINVYSPSSGNTAFLSLSEITPNPVPVFPTISSSPSCPYTGSCFGGSTNQTEIYTYQGIVNLPTQRSDWTIVAALYARNPGITTVPNPDNYDICVRAVINNTNSVGCNSSPIWDYPPPSYLCVNSTTYYSTSANDINGDSIVYSLVNPIYCGFQGWNYNFTNNSYNVPYNGGYSFQNFLNGTVNFDQNTGNVTLLPTSQHTTIWAVKAEEYRNGQLIGSIMRDIQTTSLSCNSNPPNLTGIDTLILAGPLVNSFYFCANGSSVMTFDINGLTSPPGGSTNITMSSSNLPNNATFTITNNGTNNPIGTFSWVPQYADLLNSPFFFTVDLIDDACISNISSYTYQIDLTSSSGFTFMNMTQDVSCPGYQDGSIDVTVSGVSGVPVYSWTGPNGFTASTEDISSLDPGQYDLVVTDQDGCTSAETFIVGLNSYTTSENVTDISCNGFADGIIDLTVSGGLPPFTFLWSNGANTEDITNLSSGNYSVTITDFGGCGTTINGLIVNEPTPLNNQGYISSDYNGENISCFGAFDGQITADVSGGNSPYEYSINSSSYTYNNVFSLLTEGTYNISYRDINGCVSTENITLTAPAQIQANIFSYSNISCFGTADGAIDITISGGTQNTTPPYYNITWSGPSYFSTNIDINNLVSSGTYTSVITDANNCSAFPISQYISSPQPLSASIYSQDISCYGYDNGLIDLDIVGGSSPYSVSWTGPNGFTSVLEDIQNLQFGNYNYDVIDQNGCSLNSPNINFRNVYIAEPPQITVSSSVSLIDCYGNTNGSIDLNISGISGIPDILWSGPNSYYSTSANISGLTAGVYSVTITDPNNGCEFILSEVMNPISTYNIDTNTINILCKDSADGAINLTPYNLINPIYSWTGPNGFTSSQEDIFGLVPGNYQVLVNDDSNCPVTYSFDISEPSSLNVLSSLSKVACEGGSDGSINLVVSGGTFPYTFVWSNAFGNFSFNNNLSAGAYSVTVKDNNNCLWNESFLIETKPFDTTSVKVKNVKCKGDFTGEIDIVGISGGVAPYTFLWSNGSILEDLIYIPAATYNVSITDATGCTINRFISISEPANEINVISQLLPTTCFNSFDGSVILNVSGGITPYYIDWFGYNPDSLSIGTYSYQIIDSNSCDYTNTINISGPDSLIISANIINVECFGEKTGEISLTVQFGTGTPPYSYSWTGPNSFVSYSKDIYNLSAGEYICSVTDSNGCQIVAPYNISQPNNTISSLQLITPDYSGYNISCKDGSNGWIEVNIEGGIPPFSFVWDNGETTQNIYDLTAGSYSLILSDALACTTNYQISLSQPPTYVTGNLYKSDYSSYGVSCNGENDGFIAVIPSGGVAGFTYNWTKNNLPLNGENSDSVFNLFSDNYQLFLYDQNGCMFTDSITLSEPDALEFDSFIFGPDTCELGKGFGLVQMKGGVSPYNFVWQNIDNDTLGLNFNIDTLSAGTYKVKVFDNNMCNVENFMSIDNLESPIADFTANPFRRKYDDQLSNPFVFVDLSQTFEQNIVAWNWDFNYDTIYNIASFDAYDSIVSSSYFDKGKYKVFLKIQTEFNCFDTITKDIVVDHYEIFIPSAFTPGNGDKQNINEKYKVVLYPESWIDFNIIIFSKWGGVVYESNNPDEGWDGTINNKKEAISGIYTYYIEVRNIYNEVYKYEGTISLIR